MEENFTNSPSNVFKGGAKPLRNVAFVHDFLARQGVSISQAAACVGITRQAMNHWFVKDDARLSSVQRLFSECGYDLVLSFERPAVSEGTAVVHQEEPLPSSALRSEGRLAFLENAVLTYGISQAAICRAMGVNKTALFYWLKRDDIFVSHLFDFAEAAGLVLRIEILRK